MINNRRVVAIIQVRMSSNRLPRKALLDIAGKPSILRTIESLLPSKYMDDIVLCTSTDSSDDELEKFAKENNIKLYRGDLENLVLRYLGTARQFNADIIFRFTGDCPFGSYELADLMIEENLLTNSDRTGIDPHLITEGIYGEVFTFKALEKLEKLKLDFNYSEYLTYYFTNNPHVFKLSLITPPLKFMIPQFRLTIDYIEDFKMFNRLYAKLIDLNFELTYENIIDILTNNKDIAEINEKIELVYESDPFLVDKIKTVTKISL